MIRLKKGFSMHIVKVALLSILIGSFLASTALADGPPTLKASEVHDFSFSDQELKERNERLLAEEQKLLEQLQSQEESETQTVSSPQDSPKASIGESVDSVLREAQLREAELIERARQAEAELAKKSKELNQAVSQSEAASTQLRSLSSLRSTNAETQRRLQAAEIRANELASELEKTRSRLLISEVEVERLSSILEDRNRQSISRLTGSTSLNRDAPPNARAATQSRQAAIPSERAPSSDMPIATVNVDNANLRTGPGLNNSPLMTVSKGTRLTVETRQGDWYRVISPTGARAWVASSVIAFGPGPQQSPSRTVSIKGYDSSVEDQAFQLINRRSN